MSDATTPADGTRQADEDGTYDIAAMRKSAEWAAAALGPDRLLPREIIGLCDHAERLERILADRAAYINMLHRELAALAERAERIADTSAALLAEQARLKAEVKYWIDEGSQGRALLPSIRCKVIEDMIDFIDGKTNTLSPAGLPEPDDAKEEVRHGD